MGMIASFFRVSPKALQVLKANPDEAADLIFEMEEIEELELDIDKSWHGIYFLLSGVADLDEPADGHIGRAVLGGHELGEDYGYGPLRYFEPDEVADIYNELKEISPDEFASRFDPKKLSDHGIYPMHKKWSEDDKAYLVENYDFLLRYYETAANNNEGMLMLIQ
ncbi:YfbM family protein [Neobacillus sp. YIM B06451]|uniref:YfbM family protein n=1 Tax=Neobacillus sp. YIM B06451 TaxID=3070994 RepID=UPI002931B04B|nr:YfbM family protein [Neobacillus sp. YIM B06451]